MSDKRHTFATDAITVTWSKARCIHAAECVRRLPMVFEPGRRPWVTPDAASADRVAQVVEACPTGALQHTRHDGGAAEAAPMVNTVRLTRNGPTYLKGRLELIGPDGEVAMRETRMAICRCGASRHKPLCDNAHREAGFSDAGAISDLDSVQDPGAPGGALRVIPHANGPLQLEGPFALASADGATMLAGTSTWLCRCGQSQSKPFCDGSHAAAGFTAEGVPD